jgi:hypothetical protein
LGGGEGEEWNEAVEPSLQISFELRQAIGLTGNDGLWPGCWMPSIQIGSGHLSGVESLSSK